MRGSTSKRCHCPPQYDARGRRKACNKRHGSWSYVLDVGRDPNSGQRRQQRKSGFQTQAEADTALAEAITLVEQGRFKYDERQTLEQDLNTWLDRKAEQVRATTLKGYRHHVAAYLIPLLGHHRLRELRVSHVSQMLRDIAEPGANHKIGPTTVRRVHASLRSALADACRDDLLQTNPAVNAALPARRDRGCTPGKVLSSECSSTTLPRTGSARSTS